MIKRFAFFASAMILMSTTPALAASDAETAELKAKKDAADLILNDDSFYRKWSKPGAIKTVEIAEKVKKEAEAIQDSLDVAVSDSRAWCNTRFFVNACINEARDLSYDRNRELRQVIVLADEVLRVDRTRRIAEKLEAQRAEKPEPIKMRKSHVKESESPLNLGRRSADGKIKPSEHVGQTAEDVRENNERARLAREQEEANIALYEQKQRETAARLAEAEAKAAQRRATREKNHERFQQRMKERTEAQERYERKQQEKESGLKKFF